ncbi:transcriptional regulator, partial [Planktothrix sp. FACHB-1355]
MSLLSGRISIFLSAALLGLAAFLGETDTRSVLAQSSGKDETPFYPAQPPPPEVDPLRIQRQTPQQREYRVSALLRDVLGKLWVGSWQGLARIDPNTGRILTRVNLPDVFIGALAEDKVGRIWVGTYQGLQRVDPRT